MAAVKVGPSDCQMHLTQYYSTFFLLFPALRLFFACVSVLVNVCVCIYLRQSVRVSKLCVCVCCAREPTFLSDPSPIFALSCLSVAHWVLLLTWPWRVKIWCVPKLRNMRYGYCYAVACAPDTFQSFNMKVLELLHVKIVTWICQSCCVDLSLLIHAFL